MEAGKELEGQDGKRARGRPRGRFDPKIDWTMIRNRFVRGDVEMGADGPRVVYASLRKLAEQHGVSHQSIHQKIQAEGWLTERDRFQQATTHKTDEKVAEARAEATVDALRVTDKWLARFAANVEANLVRADMVNDFDKLVRLREFLLGNAESRKDVNTTVSLDTLQARYAESRSRAARLTETGGILVEAEGVTSEPVQTAGSTVPADATKPAEDSGTGT